MRHAEVHFDGGEVHHGPSTLDLELQGDSLGEMRNISQLGGRVLTGVSWNAA